MKSIITNGITNLEPLAGNSEWYWGTDYVSGDLHEAEDAFRSGHPIRKNQLLLVHSPEGKVYEPVMLIRSGHNNRIQLLWPERRDFAVEENEYFAFLDENRLYTTVWYEDPDYREELLVRDYDTGELLERIPGSLRQMPDGQKWLLV